MSRCDAIREIWNAADLGRIADEIEARQDEDPAVRFVAEETAARLRTAKKLIWADEAAARKQ